jgi:hypothetical protein
VENRHSRKFLLKLYPPDLPRTEHLLDHRIVVDCFPIVCSIKKVKLHTTADHSGILQAVMRLTKNKRYVPPMKRESLTIFAFIGILTKSESPEFMGSKKRRNKRKTKG